MTIHLDTARDGLHVARSELRKVITSLTEAGSLIPGSTAIIANLVEIRRNTDAAMDYLDAAKERKALP